MNKILFLCPKINLDKPSGGTLHYLDLTECMMRRYPKLKIVLVASGKGWKKNKKNLNIISIPDIETTILKHDANKIDRLNKMIEEISPDCIYYRTEPFEDFPIHIKSNNPKIIEIGYNLFAKPYDIPWHISLLWPLRNALLHRWLNDAVNKFDCVLVQSISSENSIMKRIHNKTIRIVMDGANTKKFKHKNIKSYNMVKIVFVGNHLKYQGVHLLIEATKYMESKNYKIIIIGNYSKFKFPKSENIRFEGFLSNEKAIRILEKYDIGVAPYLEAKNEPYGFSPIKIFEYMAAGLAVVATDTEWNREIVKNGENGILFEENNAKDLARKLDMLIENKTALERIKKTSIRYSKKHDWSNRSEEIIEIFNDIWNNKRVL